VAAAESAFAGGLGIRLDLSLVPWKGGTADKNEVALLFAESASRLLVTVHPDKQDAFEAAMAGNSFAAIGVVTDKPGVIITGLDGSAVIQVGVAELKEAWQETLREL
jgi:phosphoribosylformylglycinamidine synthase